jgi:inner membrane protein
MWPPARAEERRATEQRREFLLTAMPEQLHAASGAAMQERARGLHKVNTYNLKAHITAQWGSLASLQPHTTVKGSRMQCGAPILMMAVGDARGIRTAQLTLGEQTLPLKPGTFHPTYSRGLHAALPEAVRDQADGLSATLELELVGTERLAIVPLGRQHRGADAQQLAPPLVRGAFFALRARGEGRRLQRPLAPVGAGHHGPARHCQRKKGV